VKKKKVASNFSESVEKVGRKRGREDGFRKGFAKIGVSSVGTPRFCRRVPTSPKISEEDVSPSR
jgi:hypothetical protein